MRNVLIAAVVGVIGLGSAAVLAEELMEPQVDVLIEPARGMRGMPGQVLPQQPPGEAKPVGEVVAAAASWLAEHQLPSGGWGQGEESARMGGAGELRDQPNVADTCMATMALLRAGHTPTEGNHRERVTRAVMFVVASVEASDERSLFITDQRGTRTQQKLGTYIDTFMAAQLLAEVKDKMNSEAENTRVNAALEKIVAKMQANQREDGQWVNEGWAPALAQAQAARAFNSARVSGVVVDEVVRERAERFAQEGARSGDMDGSAGIALYATGGQLAALEASDRANATLRPDLEAVLNDADASEEKRAEARDALARFDNNTVALREQQDRIVARMGDARFIAGFGNNGGEEFLSYLNIGESLFARGGEEWQQWNEKITHSLTTVQNADGSYTGHHCITGRTFCTAAALMVLTIDRQKPVEAEPAVEEVVE